MKGPNETAAIRSSAYELYSGREYNKAIPILEQFVADGQAIEDDYFYLGLSYLYNHEPSKAVNPLLHIYEGEGMERKDAVTWFLSVAYVASADCDNAKPLLNKVASQTGSKGKQKLANHAKELLKVIATEGCTKK